MVQSTSWITNKSYSIPENPSDRESIDAFLERNASRKVVVVQGLGFVGSVMALVIANAVSEEYAVIGVDLPNESSYWKIRSINEGVFPVISSDKKIDEFFANAMKKQNLYATYDPYAYSVADVVIVDINLDVNKISGAHNTLKGFSVDMDVFRKAITTIAKHCRKDILLLVETTVPPGTCEKIVNPVFEQVFRERDLATEYKIGHSYERVMPGPGYVDSIQNFYRVYAGVDEKSAQETEKFLRTVIHTNKYPLTRLHSTTASEMSKVLENSFRAMNIAFMQEWSCFAEEAGVNLYEVLEAIRMRPTHKNIMSPGLGVGGYCLPKDPLLASWSRQNLFNGESPLLQSEMAVRINDQMPLHTFKLIKKRFAGDIEGKKVGLLGISYLNNVGDTRYTPAELLYELLIEAGCDVYITDDFVPVWPERNIVTLSIGEFVQKQPEVIVYCTRHDHFKNNPQLDEYFSDTRGLLIVDAVGLLDVEKTAEIRKNNHLLVIGRGDI